MSIALYFCGFDLLPFASSRALIISLEVISTLSVAMHVMIYHYVLTFGAPDMT